MTESVSSDLPPRYYLDHFESLLAHVEALYPTLLNTAERDFIDGFRDLSEPARGLYVRLINRRPDFFRVRRLDYPEIDDCDAALAELERAGLIERLSDQHAGELDAVLALFTVTELRRRVATAPAQLAKAELIDRLIAGHGAALLGMMREPVIRRLGMDRVRVFKLLFFGNLHRDMDQFVIRDLGHVRFEHVTAEQLTPYFRTRDQVEAKLALSEAADRFGEWQKHLPADRIAAGFLDWHAGFGEPDPLIAPSLDRLTLKVARHVERHSAPEQALALYRLTERPPARERRARLLHKLGRDDEALSLCAAIRRAPQNADEDCFARDFPARLVRRAGRRSTSRALAEAETLELSPDWRGRVELGVLAYYAREGWFGQFAENLPWRGLFGLLFWDLLFDPAAGTLHHPLQRAPSDLFRPECFALRRAAIEARLALLADRPGLRAALARTLADKWGIANPLVVWCEPLAPLIVHQKVQTTGFSRSALAVRIGRQS